MIVTVADPPGTGVRLARLAGHWCVQMVLGLGAVGAAFAFGVALGRKTPASELMPEITPVSNSWRAAAAADDAAYLGCFTGEARAEREARRRQLGREAFRKELRAAAEAALGVEWGSPAPADGGGLRLPVTVLHKDDAERFDYVVVRAAGGWRIRSVEPRGRQAVSPSPNERLGPAAEQGDQK